MALTQVTSAGVKDGELVNADLHSAAAIALSKLGTSGTAGSGNFLRGDGAWTAIDLTALSASNLTSGTVPDARFPATLPAASGVNLTALNASNLSSGTVATARLGSGGGSSSNFLRGDGTWASAGVVSDNVFNTVAGTYAGNSLDGDSEKNTCFGYKAGYACNDGDHNVFLGYESGDAITSGSRNVAIGYWALTTQQTINDAVAIGYEALKRNTSGDRNLAIGKGAMQLNQTGSYNVAVGYQALLSSTSSSNVAVGHESGLATTGSNNVYLGSNAGKDHYGTNCIVIGAQSNPSGDSATNEITLGHTDVTKFRIPGINFELADNGGTPTNGHVLTMASGGATWAAASGGISDVVSDTSPQLGGDLDANGNHILLGDAKFIKAGHAGDLWVGHDGSHSYINHNGTGALFVQSSGGFYVQKYGTTERLINANNDGNVELFYDGARKLYTTSTGVIATDQLTVNGNINAAQHIKFPDNKRAYFGTSDELQIWHDGNTHSYITEAGGGGMAIGGSMISLMNPATTEYMFKGTENGSVELYYDGTLQTKTTSTGLHLADSKRIDFGTGSDLQIYHDGTNAVIKHIPDANHLLIQGDSIKLQDYDNAHNYITCAQDGAVELYYDNSKKFETTSSGATCTGWLQGTQVYATDYIKVSDGDKFYAGNDNDLQIYHDGSHGNLNCNTGFMHITGAYVRINSPGGEQMIEAIADGAVNLRHNSSKKLETTADGITVTGGQYTGELVLKTNDNIQRGKIYSSSGSWTTFKSGHNETYMQYVYDGGVELYHNNVKKFETTSSGVSITGDLSVSGSVGGAGKILQVKQTLKSDTASYTGWTETDISGMTCSITPSSSSSKILVIVSACLASTGSAAITLYRGSTKIGCGDTATNRTPVLFGGYAGGGSYGPMYFGAWVHSHTILDSPSTTSATTYKLRWLAESGGNTKYLNRSVYDMSNNVNHQERTCSTITLMEISA